MAYFVYATLKRLQRLLARLYKDLDSTSAYLAEPVIPIFQQLYAKKLHGISMLNLYKRNGSGGFVFAKGHEDFLFGCLVRPDLDGQLLETRSGQVQLVQELHGASIRRAYALLLMEYIGTRKALSHLVADTVSIYTSIKHLHLLGLRAQTLSFYPYLWSESRNVDKAVFELE